MANHDEVIDLDVDHEIAFALLSAGRLDQAEQVAVRMCERNPADPRAQRILGTCALLAGRTDDAVSHLQASVALDPDVPETHANLAEALRRAGRASDAIVAAERALALRPDYHTAYVNLGACLLGQGDAHGALGAFDRALELEPQDARTHARRGDAIRESGKIHDAVAAYELALQIDPDEPHAHANLGPLLMAMGRSDEALVHCRRAIELDPEYGQGYVNLGLCLIELERFEDAMDAFADAMERTTPDADLYTNVARVWIEVADHAQADHWIRAALSLEPDHEGARCARSVLWKELAHADPILLDGAKEDLEQLLGSNPDSAAARVHLAQILWELGDAREATAQLELAEQLRPEHANIHALTGQILTSAGAMKEGGAAFHRALSQNPRSVAALAGLAMSERGRLGSMQLREIQELLSDERLSDSARGSLEFGLAAYHDGKNEFAAAIEHLVVANRSHWESKLRRGWTYDAEAYASEVDQIMASFDASYFADVRGYGLDDERPVFVVGMPRSGTTLTEQVLASHAEVFGVGERQFAKRSLMLAGGATEPPAPDQIRAAAAWHIGKLEHLAERGSDRDAARIVDKLPDNYLTLGWITTTFPKARIISVRRDPRDVALSCWFQPFGALRWAFDLDHIAHRIVQYRRMMDHWEQVLPIEIYHLDYELLVSDLETEAKKLVEHLGLDWDPNCLEYYKSNRLVRTASVTQVRQPVYTKSVGKWRNYEEALRPVIERLDEAGVITPD